MSDDRFDIAVRAALETRVPPGFAETIFQRVEAEKVRPLLRSPLWVEYGAAAAASLVAVCCLWQFVFGVLIPTPA
jgi:hypothetical protein